MAKADRINIFDGAVLHFNLENKVSVGHMEGITVEELNPLPHFADREKRRFASLLYYDYDHISQSDRAQHLLQSAYLNSLPGLHGVWVTSGQVTLAGCHIQGFGHGSAVHVSGSGSVCGSTSMQSSEVGLMVDGSSAQARMEGCTIQGNYTGVAAANNALATVTGSTLSSVCRNTEVWIAGDIKQADNHVDREDVDREARRQAEARQLQLQLDAEREARQQLQEQEGWAAAVELQIQLLPMKAFELEPNPKRQCLKEALWDAEETLSEQEDYFIPSEHSSDFESDSTSSDED